MTDVIDRIGKLIGIDKFEDVKILIDIDDDFSVNFMSKKLYFWLPVL